MVRPRSLGDTGTRRVWPAHCRFCGAPIRWGSYLDQRMPLDATPDQAGPWALDGGRIVAAHRAWPGAHITRHNRHVCEVKP